MKRQQRTCQECGWVQTTSLPPDKNGDNAYWNWAERLCRRCKSPSLDYGIAVDIAEQETKER